MLMRALLFVILAAFALPLLAQSPPFSPLQTIEFGLSSLSTQERVQKKKELYQLIKHLRQTEFKDKIPHYARSITTLYNLPTHWQKEIYKKLYPLMDQSESLELLSLQSKGLYGHFYKDQKILNQYQQKINELNQSLPSFEENTSQNIGVNEDIYEVQEKHHERIRNFIRSHIKVEDIDIYDGFEQVLGKVPTTDEQIQDHVFKAYTLHEEVVAKELSRLSKLDMSSSKAMEDFIKSIDTDNLFIGNSEHPLGKAKRTLIYSDDKTESDLITKVVLKESADAHIFVPRDFNIKSQHFTDYLHEQHRLAGATDMGFQDLNILENPHVDKDPVSCFIDYCYGTDHSDHRLKKNIEYWKAVYNKKVVTRGRNVYIHKYDDSGKVIKTMYSPRTPLFKPSWWKSGKGFKEFKSVYVKERSFFSYGLGAFFGVLQGVTTKYATSIAKSYLSGGKEAVAAEVIEGAGSAISKGVQSLPVASYLSFIYATVIGGEYGTFNKIVKSGKKAARIMKNFSITTLTFGYILFAIKHYGLDIEEATLNVFGEMSIQALQNHYKVWGLGLMAKVISENYKVLTDAAKDARLTTGRFKIKTRIFNKTIEWKPSGVRWFNIVDQFWHLGRTTFKNVALELAVGATTAVSFFGLFEFNPIQVGGFEFLGSAEMVMLYSYIFGTNASYLIGKLAKLDRISPKAKDKIQSLYWFGIGHKIDPVINKMVVDPFYKSVDFFKKNFKKLKSALSSCNSPYQNNTGI